MQTMTIRELSGYIHITQINFMTGTSTTDKDRRYITTTKKHHQGYIKIINTCTPNNIAPKIIIYKAGGIKRRNTQFNNNKYFNDLFINTDRQTRKKSAKA